MMPFYLLSRRLYAMLRTFEDELLAYQQQSSALHTLEARHTLFHLERLLRNHHNPVLQKILKKYLKRRWESIQNTDIQYCQDFNNPANRFCIEIAKVLGAFHDQPYLIFLMPSLAVTPPGCYITSSYEDPLDLQQVLISDDHARLIHIVDVLEFAKEDGTLKHNSMFDGRPRELSMSEQQRLLARHPSVEQHYLMLQDKVNFMLHGETAGAYVNRLIKGLREGGMHQNGEDLNAHDESNIAIAAFDVFLQTLDVTKREQLLATSKFDRWWSNTPSSWTIRRCWNQLATPLDWDGDDDSIYCVEMVASDLAEILAENPALYQLLPYEETTLTSLVLLKARVEDSKAAMVVDLLHSGSYRYYGEAADQSLALRLCCRLSRDTGFHLTVDEMVYIATLYSTHHRLVGASSQELSAKCAEILTHEGADHSVTRIRVINQALMRMTPEFLAEVRTFLQPVACPPIQSEGVRFFSAPHHKRWREEDDSEEPEQKKICQHYG